MGKGNEFCGSGTAKGSICVQQEGWVDVQLPEFGGRCVLVLQEIALLWLIVTVLAVKATL